jgi:hypothetical protein
MTAFYILCGVMALVWLFGLAAGLIALSLGGAAQERFRAALCWSILALAIGCLGMTLFHIRYSRTVNGSGWSIDSKWFFLAPLLLGVVSLSLTLWKWRRSPHAN